jgi:hypothetical protein
MKRLTALVLALFGIVYPTQAEIITVPFSATLTEVAGRPFGVTAQAGVTPVSGSFSYDTDTQPGSGSAINSAHFDIRVASGFIWEVGGVTISSSIYGISALNSTTNRPDVFQVGASDNGGDFRVNGIPHLGSASIKFIDRDLNFYETNADVSVLPTHSQLALADFYFGSLSDGLGTGGASANYFRFGWLPEPTAALLLAQALLLASMRWRYSSISHGE